MTFEELLKQWDIDSELDLTDLAKAQQQVEKCHSKYLRYYLVEKLLLNQLKEDQKVLYKNLTILMTDGWSKEDWIANNRQMPEQRKVPKDQVKIHLAGDPEMVKLNLKVANQQDKVIALEKILDRINNKSYGILNALRWIERTQGK